MRLLDKSAVLCYRLHDLTMKSFADRDETVCFREKRHPALLSGASWCSLEGWRPAGGYLTPKRASLQLKLQRSPNKHCLDTIFYKLVILVTGGDVGEALL